MTALLVTLLLTQIPDKSADDAPKLNVFSVEIEGWDLALRSTGIAFERAISPSLSIAGGLGVGWAF